MLVAILEVPVGTRHDLGTEADQPDVLGHAALEALMDRGAAEVAAGETAPLRPVLRRLPALADCVLRERAADWRTPHPGA